MADADRLLELSRQAHGELPEDSEERQRIVAAAKFQLYLVATVANLTLVASKAASARRYRRPLPKSQCPPCRDHPFYR